MPLKLIKSDDNLDWYPIYFDSEGQGPWPVTENNAPVQKDAKSVEIALDDKGFPVDATLGIEVAFFGLRKLSTGDMTRISNRVYQMDRKGQSSFQYGTAAVEKILAACRKVKNVGEVNDPDREVQFSRNILESLPQWVNDRLTDKINAMNNLSEESERD